MSDQSKAFDPSDPLAASAPAELAANLTRHLENMVKLRRMAELESSAPCYEYADRARAALKVARQLGIRVPPTEIADKIAWPALEVIYRKVRDAAEDVEKPVLPPEKAKRLLADYIDYSAEFADLLCEQLDGSPNVTFQKPTPLELLLRTDPKQGLMLREGVTLEQAFAPALNLFNTGIARLREMMPRLYGGRGIPPDAVIAGRWGASKTGNWTDSEEFNVQLVRLHHVVRRACIEPGRVLVDAALQLHIACPHFSDFVRQLGAAPPTLKNLRDERIDMDLVTITDSAKRAGWLSTLGGKRPVINKPAIDDPAKRLDPKAQELIDAINNWSNAHGLLSMKSAKSGVVFFGGAKTLEESVVLLEKARWEAEQAIQSLCPEVAAQLGNVDAKQIVAFAEWVLRDRDHAQRGLLPDVLALLKTAGHGKLGDGAHSKPMTWQEAQKTAENHCTRNRFPGVNALMKIVREATGRTCSKTTILKAIDRSTKLRTMAAAYQDAKSISASAITQRMATSVKQTRERDPAEAASTDEIFRALLEQAKPAERAVLHNKNDAQRRELVAAMDEDSIRHLLNPRSRQVVATSRDSKNR